VAITSVVSRSHLEDTLRLDAEYYQPAYLDMELRIMKTGSYVPWGHIGGKFITGPFGSEFIVGNYVSEGSYRYVRGQDVKEFFLLDSDNVYIPEKDYERLNKYVLTEGDILISVVGTLGNAAVVDKAVPPAIFSCKSTLFRSTTINPFYLIAYLNCRFGRALLQRKVRGAVQTGLNIDDLRSLPVFTAESPLQDEIANLVLNAKESYDRSKSVYCQAENLLLEGLGLKDFKPKYELSYTANLSKAFGVRRVDAEYFQPAYDEMIDYLKAKFKIEKLIYLGSKKEIKINPNPQQAYRYIEISDIRTDVGEVTHSERLGSELPPNARIPIGGGELLVSKVRPTRKAIAIVSDELRKTTICSSAFTVFNISSPLKEYVFVALRSIVGLLQLERPTTGTEYPTLKDEDVENTLVPILPKETQQKIASLVQQSHEARRKAKELLEEAKRKVEQEIEAASVDQH